MDYYMDTAEAAEALGITVIGVIAAIKRGDIQAEKVGKGRRGQWLIPTAEVERYARERRPPGRPPEEK